MKIIITEKQEKRIFGEKIKCKCGHSWVKENDDDHPYLCHSCGWDQKLMEYDFDELKKFWENYKSDINEAKKDIPKLSKKELKSLIDQGKKHMGYSEEEIKEEIQSIIQSIKNLPSEIKLFRIIRADDRKDIDTKKPGSHYAKNKKDLLSSHSFADGVGDNSFMITVSASKDLIDVDQTIHNNLLYPHENEITLKNKGEGVKIVSVRKISDKKEVTEKWSEKYKRSIDCNNPKGFSQRAHCQGRKKKNTINENHLYDMLMSGNKRVEKMVFDFWEKNPQLLNGENFLSKTISALGLGNSNFTRIDNLNNVYLFWKGFLSEDGILDEKKSIDTINKYLTDGEYNTNYFRIKYKVTDFKFDNPVEHPADISIYVMVSGLVIDDEGKWRNVYEVSEDGDRGDLLYNLPDILRTVFVDEIYAKTGFYPMDVFIEYRK